MVVLNVPAETKQADLQSSRFYASFSPEFLSELQRGAVVQKFNPGESMLWEGDPCEGLFSLISGSVKLYKMSPAGRELILTTFEKGMLHNEVPVFDGGRNPINVEAIEECSLLMIHQNEINRAIQRHPE